MNADRLMDALGSVDDAYLLEAAPSFKRPARARVRWAAAAVAAVVVLVFCQTAPGAAALNAAAQAASKLFETMFPPEKLQTSVEGQTETALHEAAGQLPEAQVPGFAIYYDTERYQLTREDGTARLRPLAVLPTRDEIRESSAALLEGLSDEEAEAEIDALLAEQKTAYDVLPMCELEIVHLVEIAPLDAAMDARERAAEAWERVTEIAESVSPRGCTFSASSGETWDAPRETCCFVDDGQGGAFQLTVRYFQEAEEGHGARLLQMLTTFTVIAP